VSTAQATSNKATLRHFHEAVNSGEMEVISKVIDEVFEAGRADPHATTG
jgi:hypothetical protein